MAEQFDSPETTYEENEEVLEIEYSPEELDAREQAAIDWYAQKNHLNVDLSKDYPDTTSLFEKTTGGFTNSQDLKQRVGLGEDESYTDYISRGGKAPVGFELAGTMQLALEKRQKLLDAFNEGRLSEEDFLYQAYGKDILKADGVDFTSVAYWYNRKKNKEFDDPLKNPAFLSDLLIRAKNAYDADALLVNANKKSDLYGIISGSEMTEQTFIDVYGEEFEAIAKSVGGYKELMNKYTAGMLELDPFIQNSRGEYEWYYHDDGRLYKIGTDVECTYDENGRPITAKLKGSNVLKTFGAGIVSGMISIVELVPQIVFLGVDLIEELATGFKHEDLEHTKNFLEWSQSWRNKSGFFNDMYYSAKPGDSYAGTLQFVESIGTVAGFVIGMLVTSGISSAAQAGAKAAGTAAKTATGLTKVGLKAGQIGLKAIEYPTKLVSGFTTFSNGVVTFGKKGGEKAVTRALIDATTQTIAKQGTAKAVALAWGRAASASAILTAKDLSENLAYSFARNEVLPEKDKRSYEQIWGDALVVAGINFGISTILRATWDDVGITGRLGFNLETSAKRIASKQTRNIAKAFYKSMQSSARWRAFIDVVADSVENFVTMSNNMAVKNNTAGKGIGQALLDGMKESATNPGTWATVLASGYFQARGSFGSYGSYHYGIDRALDTLSTTVRDINIEMANKIRAAADAKIDATPEARAKWEADLADARKLHEDFNRWIVDGNALFEDIDKANAALKEAGYQYTIIEDTATPKEGSNEIKIKDLNAAEKSMFAIERLRNTLGETGIEIIKGSINNITKDAILDEFRTRTQGALGLMRYIDSTLKRDTVLSTFLDKTKTIGEKLKSIFTKNFIVRFLKGTGKWSKLTSQKQFDAVIDYAIAHSDYERLIGTEIMRTIAPSFNDRIAADEDCFTAVDFTRTSDFFLKELNIDEIEDIAEQDALVKKFQEEVAKKMAEHGVLMTNNEYQLFVLKEWNHLKGEERAKFESISKELNVLGEISSHNADTLDSFAVINVEYQSPKKKKPVTVQVYGIKLGNELTFQRNIANLYESMIATKAIRFGEAEHKKKGLQKLLHIYSQDKFPLDKDGNFSEIRTEEQKEIAVALIGMLAKQNIISLNDAYILITNKDMVGFNLSNIKESDGFTQSLVIRRDIENLEKFHSQYESEVLAYRNSENKDDQKIRKALSKLMKEYNDINKKLDKLKKNNSLDYNKLIDENRGLLDKKAFDETRNKIVKLEEELQGVSFTSRLHQIFSGAGEYLTGEDKIKLTKKEAKAVARKILQLSGINFGEKEIRGTTITNEEILKVIKEKPAEQKLFKTGGMYLNEQDEIDSLFNVRRIIEDYIKDNPNDESINALYENVKAAINYFVIDSDYTRGQAKELIDSFDKLSTLNVDNDDYEYFKQRLTDAYYSISTRDAKEIALDKIQKQFPHTIELINANNPIAIRKLLKNRNVGLEEFADKIAKLASTDQAVNYLASKISGYGKLVDSADDVRPSSKLIVNLAEAEIWASIKIKTQQEESGMAHIKDERTDIEKIKQTGGLAQYAFASKELNKYYIANWMMPQLEFDMSSYEAKQTLYSFLNTLGFEAHNEDALKDIPFIKYNPNADKGIMIESDIDVKQGRLGLEDVVVNFEPNDITHQLEVLALNNIAYSENSIVNPKNLLWTTQDLDSSIKIVSGNYVDSYTGSVKSAKIAGKAAETVYRLISNTGGAQGLPTNKHRTLYTALSIVEAINYTKEYFKQDYSQSKNVRTFNSDEVTRFEKYGFSFKDGPKEGSYIVESYNPDLKTILNALLYKDESIYNVIPLYRNSKNVIDKIAGFGVNLIAEKDSTAIDYDNFMYINMSSQKTDANSAFNTLCDLNGDKQNFHKYNLDDIDISKDSIGNIISNLEKIQDNLLADIYKFSLKGILELSSEPDEYAFLSIPEVRKVVNDALLNKKLDKDSRYNYIQEHIEDAIERYLTKPDEDGLPSKGKATIDDLITDDLEKIKSAGRPQAESLVTAKHAETLGVRYTEAEVKELVSRIDKDVIENLYIKSASSTTLSTSLKKISDSTDLIDNNARAVAHRVKFYNDETGKFEYHITIDDLATMRTDEMLKLCEILQLDNEQLNKIAKLHSNIRTFLFSEFKKNFPQFDENKFLDELVLTKKLELGINIGAASVEEIGTAFIVDGVFDRVIGLHESRLALQEYKLATDLTMRKIISIAKQAHKQGLLQRGVMLSASDIVMSNRGSQMIFNMGNSLQAGRYGVALYQMTNKLKNKFGYSDDVANEFAQRIIDRTTGTELSDGYEGFFIFKDGKMTEAVRHVDRDDEYDNLMLEILKQPGELSVLAFSPNSALNATRHEFIDITPKLRTELENHFITKILLNKKNNESVENYIAGLPPHIRILEKLPQECMKELELHDSMRSVFMETAMEMAEGFDGSANLSTEAVYNYMLNKARDKLGMQYLSRDDFEAAENNFQRTFNDVIYFGISERYLHPHLRSAINLLASNTDNSEARDAIKRFLRSGDAHYNKDNVSEKELLLQYILESKSGSCLSKIIRTHKGVDLVKSKQNVNVILKKYHDAIRNTKGNTYGIDSEWVFDREGNNYITQISFVKYIDGKPSTDTKDIRTFRFNVESKLKDKDTTEWRRWAASNGIEIEPIIKYAGNDIAKLEDFVKEFKSGDNFISYNGKGQRSDIDTLRENKLDAIADIIEKNHFDLYEDFVSKILTEESQDSSGHESLDELYDRFKDNNGQISIKKKKTDSSGKQIEISEILYKPSGKAHEATEDIYRMAALVERYINGDDNIITIKSQHDIYRNELKNVLTKFGITKNQNKIISETDILLKKYLKDNHEILDARYNAESKSLIDSVINYKELTNKKLRSAMSTINAYRDALNKKTFNKIYKDTIDDAFKRTKETINRIIPYYTKGQNLFKYLVYKGITVKDENGKLTIDLKDALKISNRLYMVFDAMKSIYGKEIEGKMSLSTYGAGVALADILEQNKINDLFNRLNSFDASHNPKYEEFEKFNDFKNETDIEKITTALSNVIDELSTKSDLSEEEKELLDSLGPNAEYAYRMQPVNTRIKGCLELFETSVFGKDFNDNMKRYAEKALLQLIENPDINDGEDINTLMNTYYREPKQIEAAVNIIEENPSIGRVYGKITRIEAGTTVEDASGINTEAGSDTIIISRDVFETLYNDTYENKRIEFGLKPDELMSIGAHRHPASNPDLRSYKLVVVEGNNRTVRMTPLAVFSNHSGDMDGDNIVLYKLNSAQHKLLQQISPTENAALTTIDTVFMAAVKQPKGKISTDETFVLGFPMSNSKQYKDIISITAEYADRMAANPDNADTIYDEYRATIHKKKKISSFGKERVDMLLNYYGLKKEVFNNTNSYICKNSQVYSLVKQDTAYYLNAPAINHFNSQVQQFINTSALLRATQDVAAATSGKSQEYSFKVKSGDIELSPSNIRPRLFTIDSSTEILLRHYFENASDNEKSTTLTSAFKKLKTAGIPKEEISELIEYSKQGFDNFMYAMYLADIMVQNVTKTNYVNFVNKNKNVMTEAAKDLRNKMELRKLALNTVKDIEKRFPGFTLKSGESAILKALGYAKYRSDMEGENASRVASLKDPISIKDVWVMYPIAGERTDAKGNVTKDAVTGKVENFTPTKAFTESYKIVRSYRIKGDGKQWYKKGQKVKEINGVKFDGEATVAKAFPNGDVIVLARSNDLNGLKIINPIRKDTKNIVTYQDPDALLPEGDKLEDIAAAFAAKQKIKPNEIAGISFDKIGINKQQETILPGEYVKFGNYVFIKQNLSIIEDAPVSIKESKIDDYSLHMNTNNNTGISLFGGMFVKEKNGKFVIDDSEIVDINNFLNSYGSRQIGLTNGIDLYQWLTTYTLCALAPMNDADLKKYSSKLLTGETDGDNGIEIIWEILDTYFGGSIANARENATAAQKALLSDELLITATPYVLTGIDKDGESVIKRSKRALPKDAAVSATKSRGYNTTNLSQNLVDTGTFGDRRYISKLDLLNTISNATGKGVLSNRDIISRIDLLPKGKTNISEAAATAAYDTKVGVPALAYQETLTTPRKVNYDMKNIYDELDYNVVHDPSKGIGEFEKYKEIFGSVTEDGGFQKTGSNKLLHLSKFFAGSEDTALDRANQIDSRIPTIYNVGLPSNRFIFKDGKVQITPDDIESGVFSGKLSQLKDTGTKKYSNSMWAKARKQDLEGLTYGSHEKLSLESMNSFAEIVKSLSDAIKPIDESPEDAKLREAYSNYFRKKPEPINPMMTHEENKDAEFYGWRTREYNKNVTRQVESNILYPQGLRPKKDASGETVAILRNYATKDVDLIYDDARKQSLRISTELNKLYMTIKDDPKEVRAFEDYIAVKGIVDRIKDNVPAETRAILESKLQDKYGVTFDEAVDSIASYEKRRPRQVNMAQGLVTRLKTAADNVSFTVGARGISLYTISSVFSSKKKIKSITEKDAEAKQKFTEAVNFTFSDNPGEGEILNFFESVNTIGTHIAKAQSIINSSKRFKANGDMNNADIKYRMLEMFIEDINDGTSTLRSNKAARRSMFNMMMQGTGIRTIDFTKAKDEREEYRMMFEALTNKKNEYIASNSISGEMTLLDMENIASDSMSSIEVREAIEVEKYIQQLQSSYLATNKDLETRMINELQAINDGGVFRLTDTVGRLISAKHSDNVLLRKPITELDTSDIVAAIRDNVGSKDTYERRLCIRAMAGEVYKMDALLATKLDEHVFTTRRSNKFMTAIRKTSGLASKFIMGNALKIVRRMLQFTGYDFLISSTANPHTFKYMPKSIKELNAFFQSKGAALSEDLQDYLKHQGFAYSELKGYDPVQMESTGKSGVLDRLYFDKVNKLFSHQNLLCRYALYLACKEDFKANDNRYGVAFSRREAIDKMSDPGDKAIYVVDSTLGGPGGFSELSKKASRYGFVFTTFPLAVVRWTLEGAETVKDAVTNAVKEGFKNGTGKDLLKHVMYPGITLAATYGIISLVISLLADMYGVSEEDKQEMIKKSKFIDPVNTIINDDLVTVENNSIFQIAAISEMFESLTEKDATIGERLFGFVNDNVISKINPLMKSSLETLLSIDTYKTKIVKNDNPIIENASRKLLGYVIGYAGSTALINEMKAEKLSTESTLDAIKRGLISAVEAEFGNTKAYKSDKKTYTKALDLVRSYNSILYKDERFNPTEYGTDFTEAYSLGGQIRKVIEDGGSLERVYSLIEKAIVNGANESEIRNALRSISITAKLETFESKGVFDHFIRTLSDADRNSIAKAIEYEKAKFPFLETILDEISSSNTNYYSNIGRYRRYYPTDYDNHYYNPARFYQPRTNAYSYNNKKKYKEAYGYQPDRMFINRLTDFTGSKAKIISDIIGKIYERKQKPKGNMESTDYKERRNTKQSISDWKN